VKIYTRTGDDGTTGLYFGGRVRKDSPRPTAYGEVDELQAALGLVRAAAAESEDDLAEKVVAIEGDLWVLMAELATAEENAHKLVDGETRVTAAMVTRLERWIDEVSEHFPAPTEFVVPGETEIGARLDVARTVCRRAERAALSVVEPPSLVGAYLNRLSDLCWTLARWQDGRSVPVRSIRPQ
jgi:cob(I)alamin adenosyltransferase